MAIPFSCSDCGHTIKAPDDAAGRRVKCPKCKTVLTVPDSGVAEGNPSAGRKSAARPVAPRSFDDEDQPRTRSRPRDDDGEDRPARKVSRNDDDEDDRPRSRRGRQSEDSEDLPRRGKKSNKGLIIGLAAGGAALVIGAVVVIILLMNSGDGNQGKGAKGGGGKVGGGPAPRDRALENDLKMIGLAYHNYNDAFRKAPGRAEDLFPFLEGAGSSASQALQSGRVIFIYNVRLTEMVDGTINTIIAYERDAPTNGGLVLFGDASTNYLSAAEFGTKTKATPRK